jgi:hypothetical protein
VRRIAGPEASNSLRAAAPLVLQGARPLGSFLGDVSVKSDPTRFKVVQEILSGSEGFKPKVLKSQFRPISLIGCQLTTESTDFAVGLTFPHTPSGQKCTGTGGFKSFHDSEIFSFRFREESDRFSAVPFETGVVVNQRKSTWSFTKSGHDQPSRNGRDRLVTNNLPNLEALAGALQGKARG